MRVTTRNYKTVYKRQQINNIMNMQFNGTLWYGKHRDIKDSYFGLNSRKIEQTKCVKDFGIHFLSDSLIAYMESRLKLLWLLHFTIFFTINFFYFPIWKLVSSMAQMAIDSASLARRNVWQIFFKSWNFCNPATYPSWWPCYEIFLSLSLFPLLSLSFHHHYNTSIIKRLSIKTEQCS